MLLNLAMSPSKGWEDIDDDSPDARRTLTHGFLPLLLLTSLSIGCQAIYHHEWAISQFILGAIILFGKFFISYYVAMLLMGIFLPKITAEGGYSESRTSNFCLLSMSMLAMIALLENCLPEGMPLVKFLPLYVIVIMWQGRGYLSIPSHNEVRFIIAALVSVMGPILMFDMMFSFL
ncbi:MAG: hypothetical protein K2M65_03390 [Muribaculaceae bacterium]|nr:hypothetical protein [Muribaculaceae bacterium]